MSSSTPRCKILSTNANEKCNHVSIQIGCEALDGSARPEKYCNSSQCVAASTINRRRLAALSLAQRSFTELSPHSLSSYFIQSFSSQFPLPQVSLHSLTTLAHLGRLGPSWNHLGLSWMPLGPPWGRPGPALGLLKPICNLITTEFWPASNRFWPPGVSF